MGDLLQRAAVALLLLQLQSLLLLSSSPKPVAAARPSLGAVGRRYDSIFSFGDSYTDTGNNPVAFAWYDVADPVMRPPYGSTFFGRPTGRNCDGRLVVDFIAELLDLPLVLPFLAHGHGDGSLRRGANFAVGSATAVDASFFHHDGEALFPINVSLSVQLQWFESLKPSLCATPKECQELFGSSLFLVGELGFNDYSFSLARSKSVQLARSLVQDVVGTISMAIERLIEHGATRLVVSGMVPAGCVPPFLVLFDGADPASYDPRTGCLKEMNELSIHHNTLLQESLGKIRARHPDVEVAYADFFSPVMAMVESPGKYGFLEDVLAGCCGGPGRYHLNADIVCGDPGADTCEDPSARLFWDGTHLTEAANRYIADEWLSSIISPARASSY
ncbi:GDSL esterase/lipase At5g45910-like [Miscanthus floridulus]|uniref:GDSL esterase/lipase At5g45910-like n=1 Tax=Miscanthus floridulus TaxID=154761 RepID=UPI003459E6D7